MIRAGLSDGRPLHIDARVKLLDGEIRWLAIRAQPMRDHAGTFCGFVGVAHDITAQKQNLSRTDSLLREVSHRSKNMLALILAMARLTARDAVDVKAHLKQFALRVAGLAASQDLIVAADWQSVDFSTLAAAELEAVARSDAARVKISGPPVLLTPEAAQTLGMILTELVLNAVAHGALSIATGDVELSWHVTENRRITISWREIGGPPYDAARPKGYGISVIERFSTQGLKLDASTSFEPDGFTWSLDGPLGNIGTLPSDVVHDTRA
jgi:two-component sensor histidine kinase